MKNKKIIIVSLASFIFIGSLFANSLEPYIKASKNLKTISCFVTATNFARNRKSEIQYTFSFKRDREKMRIEYLNPRNMRGTKIALDGIYFYSYLPNLHRITKRKIDPKSAKNPGKDMGLFFYYMKGDFTEKINKFKINYMGKGKVKIKTDMGNKKIEAEHFSFKNGDEREEIWFDTNTCVPVKIMRYNRNKLLLEIDVSNIKLDLNLSDSLFKL